MKLTEKELKFCEDEFCHTDGCINYSADDERYCYECQGIEDMETDGDTRKLKRLWDKQRESE